MRVFSRLTSCGEIIARELNEIAAIEIISEFWNNESFRVTRGLARSFSALQFARGNDHYNT